MWDSEACWKTVTDVTMGLINHATNSTKKKQRDNKRGLYHGLPKELQIAVLMMCMEDAHGKKNQNNDDLNRSREWQAQKDKGAEEKGLVDAEEPGFIQPGSSLQLAFKHLLVSY